MVPNSMIQNGVSEWFKSGSSESSSISVSLSERSPTHESGKAGSEVVDLSLQCRQHFPILDSNLGDISCLSVSTKFLNGYIWTLLTYQN